MEGRRLLAQQILLNAETDPVGDTGSRPYILYRAAGAWLPLDRAHAIGLYRAAFAAARVSKPEYLRADLEAAIAFDLVPVSLQDALELLPDADHLMKTRLYRAAMTYSLQRGDIASATNTLRAAQRQEVFFTGPVADLLRAIPAEDVAGRTSIFLSVVDCYSRVEPEDPKHPTRLLVPAAYFSASRLISEFETQLPREAILRAITVVLDKAAENDKDRPLGSARVGELAFNQYSDIELFAVAPALQRLDPDRAVELLSEHSATVAMLKRFPRGLADFYTMDNGYDGIFSPPHRPGSKYTVGNEVCDSEAALRSANFDFHDLGLEFTVPLKADSIMTPPNWGRLAAYPDAPEAKVLPLQGHCPEDWQHRLELARTVEISQKMIDACSAACSYHMDFATGTPATGHGGTVRGGPKHCGFHSSPEGPYFSDPADR
jgi:hypothetical protein